jgi:hypothetical protein
MQRLSILLLLVTCGASLSAQNSISNTGNLQVHSGGNLSFFSDFYNHVSAALLNNGNIYCRGHVTNDQAASTAGTGTFRLTGSSAQTLSGAAELSVFDLVTDNSNGITLNNNLGIEGHHTYVNGLIHSSNTPNYLVYRSGSTYSGSQDSRHVTGWVKKIGADDFIFPVGDATYERPVAVSDLSTAAEINGHYYINTPNYNNLLSPLVLVRRAEYWRLDKISGGTAKITLNWDHSKVPMDNMLIPEIHSSHYISGNWTSTGGVASGTIGTTGAITSNAMATFGEMALAYTSFPVPLKLITFDGRRLNHVTGLTWVTENEYNVDRFEIERSFDARQYSVIGTTGGRNHSNRENYSFDDHTRFLGIAYYRLRMIDNDGTYAYSRIVAVTDGMTGQAGINVLNPASNIITVLNKSIYNGPFAYALYAENGQLLTKGFINLVADGTSLIQLPVSIPQGMYFLELNNTATRFRQKLLIGK